MQRARHFNPFKGIYVYHTERNLLKHKKLFILFNLKTPRVVSIELSLKKLINYIKVGCVCSAIIFEYLNGNE